MFTSRAEFRLHLRPENADFRLTSKGREVGCVGYERWDHFSRSRSIFDQAETALRSNSKPKSEWTKILNLKKSSAKMGPNKSQSAWEVLSVVNNDIGLADLADVFEAEEDAVLKDVLDQGGESMAFKLETEARYERFVDEQRDEILEIRRDEKLVIPIDFDYTKVSLKLSIEEIEKLSLAKPTSIAAASRIPGVTPNAVLLILRSIKKQSMLSSNQTAQEVENVS